MEPTKAYILPSKYYVKVRDALIWRGFGMYERDNEIGLGFHKNGKYLDAGDIIFSSGKVIILPANGTDTAGKDLERLLSSIK
jgi:hypothetical protein